MTNNMMIGYDIYDCFTMEHFRLRQRMTLTTKIYCSRLYLLIIIIVLNVKLKYIGSCKTFHRSILTKKQLFLVLVNTYIVPPRPEVTWLKLNQVLLDNNRINFNLSLE
jgi:hypothetical protein